MIEILLLEDDLDLSEQIAASLIDEGMNVTAARSAQEALDLFGKSHFDLVISDLFIHEDGSLSQDGGVRLISNIKQLQAKRVPVIAISGAFSNDKYDLFQDTVKTVGANAVLAKPFEPDELLDLIAMLMARGIR